MGDMRRSGFIVNLCDHELICGFKNECNNINICTMLQEPVQPPAINFTFSKLIIFTSVKSFIEDLVTLWLCMLHGQSIGPHAQHIYRSCSAMETTAMTLLLTLKPAGFCRCWVLVTFTHHHLTSATPLCILHTWVAVIPKSLLWHSWIKWDL